MEVESNNINGNSNINKIEKTEEEKEDLEIRK
jgi:hypothetical protein